MLPAFLLNRWFLGGAAVVVLVGSSWLAGHRSGKEAGKGEQRTEDSQAIEKQRERDEAATKKVLDGYQKTIDAQNSIIEAQAAQASKFAQAVASISAQRQAASSDIGRLSEGDVRPAIHKALGELPTQAPLTSREERAALACLVDQPLCQKENEALKGQLGALGGQVAALNDKVVALDGKYQALDGYTQRLHGYYVTAWNMIPKKRNKLLTIISLGYAGKAPKLSIPSPSEVQ